MHHLAWTTFEKGTKVAKGLHLYGAGQDMLADAFSGNVRGMGPGVAEMEFVERTSEPVLVFMADKTSAGAWNLPLYKMFADPFTTAGLIIAPSLHQGFRFEVHDIREHKKISFDCPEDLYDIVNVYRHAGPFYYQTCIFACGRHDRRVIIDRAVVVDCRQIRREGRPGHDRAGAAKLPRSRRGVRTVPIPLDHRRMDARVSLRPAHAGFDQTGHSHAI